MARHVQRVSLKALAERCGIKRSALLQKLRRHGIELLREPASTAGGIQLVTTIAKRDADRIAAPYEHARKEALAS